MRFGVPEFKLEKSVIDRRIAPDGRRGNRFRTGIAIGVARAIEVRGPRPREGATCISGEQLRAEFDAVVLAIGSTRPA